MTIFLKRFARIFRSPAPVPAHLARPFLHFYLEIAWFGMLSGSTIAFLAVYATRSGASAGQIGLLSAVPGLVNLIFALPAGTWLSRHSIGKAVFWTSVLHRMFYLLLLPLPVLFLPHTQVWLIIGTTLMMTIPGTALVVGFNSMFGDVVPVEWRGHVVGIRNAIVAIVTTIFTLISGEILHVLPFPMGYQVVFGLGIVGAAMSSYHLYVLSSIVGLGSTANGENGPRSTAAGRRLAVEIRALYDRSVQSLRLDVMVGKFARIMGLLFCWHLAQFMTIPTITPFVVNNLRLTDQVISLAGAMFNMVLFFGSLGLNHATLRYGNKALVGYGIMALSFFPILTSLGGTGYVLANIVAGLGWAMFGGAMYNYILENVPNNDRPAHLAWYSLISSAAILIGSLSGPALAGVIGIGSALVLFGIARFLSGAAILRWG